MYVLDAEPMQCFVRSLLDLGSGESGLDVTTYKAVTPLYLVTSASLVSIKSNVE